MCTYIIKQNKMLTVQHELLPVLLLEVDAGRGGLLPATPSPLPVVELAVELVAHEQDAARRRPGPYDLGPLLQVLVRVVEDVNGEVARLDRGDFLRDPGVFSLRRQ